MLNLPGWQIEPREPLYWSTYGVPASSAYACQQDNSLVHAKAVPILADRRAQWCVTESKADDMEYLAALGQIAAVFLLACLSPGPVWVVITSTSMGVSRKAGILTGLGVAGATLTWATLAMLGVGLLAQLTWVTIAVKLGGAAYLVWIGLRMIAGARSPALTAGSLSTGVFGSWTAVRRGYLSSITSPKAAAFFGSIFVVMLPAHAPSWVYVAVVILLAALSAGWHCGLAVLLSVAPIQLQYRRAKAMIDRAVGVVLIALGVRLAVSR